MSCTDKVQDFFAKCEFVTEESLCLLYTASSKGKKNIPKGKPGGISKKLIVSIC